MSTPGKAKRFVVSAEDLGANGYLECDHCHGQRSEGDYAFRTPQGVYCSTTCKMWHEGQSIRSRGGRCPVSATATPLPCIPFAGSDTFGVPRRRPDAIHFGGATLVPISDAASAALAAGDVVLFETATRALVPLRVARIRTGVAGELGAEYEVPVVDARTEDGHCLTYAPGDLLTPEVEP